MPREAIADDNRRDRRRPRAENIRRPQIGALFWWTIIIIILGICAVLSWFLSIYVFNHPNEPFPYRILTKLNKIEAPEQFPSDSPPQGKFRSPRALLEEDFAGFEERHLEFINSNLLRDYLESFRRSEGVLYVKGKFTVDQVRELGEDDLFQTGLVVRASAPQFPNAAIEVVLPTKEPAPAEIIPVGEEFDLTGSYFAAVIHAAKFGEDSMCFTLVPIVYGTKDVAPGARVTMRPPRRLNIEGRWPLTSPPEPEEEAGEETPPEVAGLPEEG